MNRALVLLVGLCALFVAAPKSFAQAPKLTINGITANTNGAVVDTPFGSRVIVEIADTGNANGSYALAAAFAHNANSVGWWLAQASTYPFIKPWTLLTGIPTSLIEAQYQTDLYPDSSGSPFVKLNASGKAVLVYQIPSKDHFPPGFTASVFFQAVTRDVQANLDVTNGLELFIHEAASNGRLTLARGTVSGTDVLSVQIGTLAFAGDPSGATYTQNLAGPYDTADIAATGFFELIKNEASDNGNISSFQSWARLGVGRFRENTNFARLTIPAATTSDGKSIPARDLFRVADTALNLSGFLIVNHGDNPNIPGVRAFVPVGCMLSDPTLPTLNKEYWQKEVLIGWDNLHALVAIKPNDLTVADRIFIMTLDGSTPYTDPVTSQPTAVKEISPVHEPVWLRAPTTAAATVRDRFYFFTCANQNFSAFATHGMYYVPLDGSTTPVLVDVDPLRKNNQEWQNMDEDSTLVSNDGSTLAFIGQYDTKTEDWYAVKSVTNPGRAINISGWKEDTKLDQPGTATDGNALANISPGGRWLAYYKDRNNAEDLFLAATDGSFTESNKRVSAVFGSGVGDDGRDVLFVDDDYLVFFYGSDQGGAFNMDLYRYRISDNSYYNLTNTSGERLPDYTKAGTIHSRGEFFADSRRYLYFIRDHKKTSVGNELANIVGLDTVSWLVFDLTGSEFSNGWVPDVNGSIDTSAPKAETWSFMKGAGSMKNLMFFKAYYADRTPKTDQMFLFDSENPFSALPLTNLTQADFFMRNISPASFGPFVAFTGSDDSTSQSVYLLDVPHLKVSVLDSGKSIQNGSVVFLPPVDTGTTAPGSLAYTIGVSPEANPTGNVQLRFLDLEPGAVPVTFPIVGGNELVHVLDFGR